MKKIICFLLITVMCLEISGCSRPNNSAAAPKAYELDGDTVPSFTDIVGAHKFEGVESTQNGDSSSTSVYRYSGVRNTEKDAQKYRDYLLDNKKFALGSWFTLDENGSGDVNIPLINGKSFETDKKLTLLITYNEQKKTVDIALTKDGQGVADVQTQTVGQDSHGFLNIPKEWHVFDSIEGTATLMSWSRDTKTIVHLDIIPGDYGAEAYAVNSMNTLTKQVGEENVGSDFEEMDGCKAYYIMSKHPNNAVLLVWYFDDDKGVTHYIAAEALQNEWEEVYNIAHTFHLKQEEMR